MKTFLLFAGILCLSSTAVFAQDDIKPLAGARNLEIQINPFTTNPLSLTSGYFSGIKFRYFKSPTLAYRIIGNLSTSYSNYVVQDAGTNGSSTLELKNSQSSFSAGLSPGFEKHFAGTSHLSPYFGAELAVNVRTNKSTQQSQQNFNTVVETTIINSIGGLSLGASGFAGLDIYLIKHLYIGTELGYGFSYYSPFVRKTTYPSGQVKETKVGTGDSFGLSPWLQSTIRVGYIF